VLEQPQHTPEPNTGSSDTQQQEKEEKEEEKQRPFFSRRRSLLVAFILGVAILAATATAALAATFSNPATITIPDSGKALPYHSDITVSGLTGTISDLNVTLYGLSHGYPDDLAVLLVGPGGENVILMSDAGGGPSECGGIVSNVTLTFDDEAAGKLPDSAQITSGSYQPTQGTIGDFCGDPRPATFPGPAPFPPYGKTLSAFDTADPNGTYSLYVFDDTGGGGLGSIAGGWSLDINPVPPPPPHHKKKHHKHHHRHH
jgi:hypothetical protein